MTQRITFYLLITVLVVLDAVLLSSPNLLGKIGLLIYKYHYLRTFSRTLLTIGSVVGLTMLIESLIVYLVKQRLIKKLLGVIILSILLLASIAVLIKTHLDFNTWTYSHTGIRFIMGAYLLPVILIICTVYMLFNVFKYFTPHHSDLTKNNEKTNSTVDDIDKS